MARVLDTRLPTAMGDADADLCNRLVRILELNLQGFTPTATYQYTNTTRDQNLFSRGDIIWNLTEDSLQVFDGYKWQTLYAPDGKGVKAAGQLGKLTVSTNGATTVPIL